jgi:predicted metal-dependent hydrolase
VGPRALRPAEPVAWDSLDEAELWAYGVDLFNARYYWEAHEAWETLWRTTLRGSPEFLALKGLIQICAALLKVQVDNQPAARRLASRGIGLLSEAAEQRGTLHGLRLANVVRVARTRLLDAPGPLHIEQVVFELEPDA